MSSAALTPWRVTCQRLLGQIGDSAPQLRRSMWLLFAASVLQGLSYSCLFPLFSAALTQHEAHATLVWFLAMSALMLASITCRWRAQGFDYLGEGSRATHALRTRLGEQLRRVPLEALSSKRAGEINAALLGNVVVIDTIFGIPGTHNLEFYRHLSEFGIRAVTPRHEQAAGYGADGYFLVSGRPGVVITTSGPGLTNVITAAATVRVFWIRSARTAGSASSRLREPDLGITSVWPCDWGMISMKASVSLSS